MRKQTVLLAPAIAAVLAAHSAGALSAPAAPERLPGPSMMNGYGMMMPWMMGPMMGPGAGPAMMGPGMMGPGGMRHGMMGWMWNQPALNLSTGDVKAYFENWIAFSGNTHIKVGTVEMKNDTTITADIVTTDKNGLVERFDVDRRTGTIYTSRG